MSKICVFDLEIIEDPETHGGWGAARRGECGLSVGVIYDSQTERPHVYWGFQIQEMLTHLNSADILITFNGADFDLPIVEALAGRPVEVPNHIDVLREIVKLTKSRKGYSLNELGQRCLGRSKEAPSGKMALTWYANKDWAKLVSYCISDVLLTRDLASWISLHGHVLTPGGESLKVEIDLPTLL